MRRRITDWAVFIVLAAGIGVGCTSEPGTAEPPSAPQPVKIPVILDTDIGTDIDDTWALALLLECPELDVKLVVTDHGDTEARARITAKFLDIAGRSDIPVGIGKSFGESYVPQKEWAADYDLSRYPGVVHADGIQAMIDIIMQSPTPVVILAIGPVPNLPEALAREPRIAGKARVIAMSGSVDVGYDGKQSPDAEYNVKEDIPASQAMYRAPWDLLLAPLDTAGLIKLQGDLHRRIVESEKPALKALMENYRLWAQVITWTKVDPELESSILFDTLAVALAFRDDWVEIETLNLDVDDLGFTVRSAQGRPIRSAMRWKDLEGYNRWMVDRLAGTP